MAYQPGILQTSTFRSPTTAMPACFRGSFLRDAPKLLRMCPIPGVQLHGIRTIDNSLSFIRSEDGATSHYSMRDSRPKAKGEDFECQLLRLFTMTGNPPDGHLEESSGDDSGQTSPKPIISISLLELCLAHPGNLNDMLMLMIELRYVLAAISTTSQRKSGLPTL